MKFFALFILLLNYQRIYSLSQCQYYLPDGILVDFSKMRSLSTDYRYILDKRTYFANFCGSLINKCSSLDSASAIFYDDKVCISSLSDKWAPKVDYINSNNKELGIRLSMSEGERCLTGNEENKLSYILNCNNSVEMEFISIIKPLNCYFEYHFISKYGCYTNHLNNLTSDYSTYYILFFLSLFLLYCLGFSYYNYIKYPEDGIIKSMPNRVLWMNLFYSINSILSWLFDKVRRKNYRSRYDNF